MGHKTADFLATLYALEAIETIPKEPLSKICVNTDSFAIIKAMGSLLKHWSENNYRQFTDPTKTLQNLDIMIRLNALMRSNSKIQFRWKYAPSDCRIPLMDLAVKLAKSGKSSMKFNQI